MTPFDCSCGAVCCRGVVRGSDYQLPELIERYGDHVSDFIRSAIRSEDTRCQLPFEIVRKEVGSGLVARREWKANDVIIPLSWGPFQPEPNRWTVQSNHRKHAEPLPFELRYINHSCDPNVFFDVDADVLRAIKNITPGDEFSFFYPSTEWSMAEQFDCMCGMQSCIGRISGAADLPLEVLQRFRLTGSIRRGVESRKESIGPVLS